MTKKDIVVFDYEHDGIKIPPGYKMETRVYRDGTGKKIRRVVFLLTPIRKPQPPRAL